MIAAITSCTNTSNPSVMLGAGLLARNAVAKGLRPSRGSRRRLSPGSQVVGEYLEQTGLQKDFDALGFNLAGYGCMTCIGNSGPLPDAISKAINDNDIVAAAVISGNRNFEGRVNPDVKANYLASPPLVVAYALAGSLDVDLATEPLGQGSDGKPVYLRDIWPSNEEVASCTSKPSPKQIFAKRYADVFKGDEHWQKVEVAGGSTYKWSIGSTYVQNPPYFEGLTKEPAAAHRRRGCPHPRASSSIRSRPTTSRRRARSRRRRPAGSYLLNIRCGRPTSTSTARAAATMK